MKEMKEWQVRERRILERQVRETELRAQGRKGGYPLWNRTSSLCCNQAVMASPRHCAKTSSVNLGVSLPVLGSTWTLAEGLLDSARMRR